jgi:hypothetical protein
VSDSTYSGNCPLDVSASATLWLTSGTGVTAASTMAASKTTSWAASRRACDESVADVASSENWYVVMPAFGVDACLMMAPLGSGVVPSVAELSDERR